MIDFIEALNIFMKYAKNKNCLNPFHCEHDVLYVCCVEPEEIIDKKDIERLDELGFFISEDVDEGIMSFRFGSC